MLVLSLFLIWQSIVYVCISYILFIYSSIIVVDIVHENKEHHLYYYFLAYPAPQRLIYHCLICIQKTAKDFFDELIWVLTNNSVCDAIFPSNLNCKNTLH